MAWWRFTLAVAATVTVAACSSDDIPFVSDDTGPPPGAEVSDAAIAEAGAETAEILSGVPEAQGSQAALPGADVTAALSGRDATVETTDGDRVAVAFNEDGSLVELSDQDPDAAGVWFVSGNVLCDQWRRWRDNSMQCFNVVRIGEQRLAAYDTGGKLAYAILLAP
jgi:dipeptidyl aminopeptidase/acylaminoacyl peptidase